MKDELDDWELALLVESRKYDNPTVLEASAAEAFRDHRGLIDDASDIESPVVVEREVAQEHENTEELREAASGIDDPEVIEAEEYDAMTEAVDAVEDVLADAIVEQNGLRDEVVEAMSAPQMVDQFRDEDDGGLSLEAMSQTPETDGAGDGGGNGNGGGSDPSLEDIDAETREAAREKLDKADRLEKRTPEFASELEAEACDLLEVDDLDAVDLEVL